MATTNTPGTGDDRQAGLSKAQRRAQRAEQQKAELAARQRKQNTRRVLITAVAAIALIALIVVIVVIGKNHNSGGGSGGSNAAALTKYELAVGDPKAPHHIVIYEDFLCPYCGHLELESETGLDAAAKAGKVYIEYRPFNLLQPPTDGPYSEQALNAFIAVKEIAGDSVALQFHNLLYHNQPTEPGPSDDKQGLITLANQVVPKADQSKVADAINNDTYKSQIAQITDAVEQGKGINGTPTVYFDGKQYSDETGTHTDEFAGYENMADNLIKAVNQPAAKKK